MDIDNAWSSNNVWNVVVKGSVCFILIGLLILGQGHAMAKTDEIVFLDFGHDSGDVHNKIAAFIIQHGYGYDVDHIHADTHAGMMAMRKGDLHVGMELWIDNIRDLWNDALDAGDLIDLGNNFPDAPQGWYVPTYMIEGDPERGIEPMAPDLKTVHDLPKYWELFKDPENPRKGRFYNSPTLWETYTINKQKMEAYGLTDTYTMFTPGSQAALDVSIATAYRRGLPWLGYYWEPTSLMAEYDMTMLEEPEYSDECWETDRGCAYPAGDVVVFAYGGLPDIAPDLIPFLENYQTTLAQTNEIVNYFESEANRDYDAVPPWFLKEYEDVWTEWVPDDVAAKVKEAL